MSRPYKRPRLHFVGSISPPPGSEIDAARKRNDNLLKARWESLFEKFEYDFVGIGDEIGFINNEIVVDNGHLKAMQDEADIGVDRRQGMENTPHGSRILLRALTTAPSECASSVSDIDEVQQLVQSIETVADHHFMNENYSDDDDLFRPVPRPVSEERHTVKEEDLSDDDALFGFKLLERSPSADSLFNPMPNHEILTIEQRYSPSPFNYVDDSPHVCAVPSEEFTLEQQRWMIRREIKNALNEQKEEEEFRFEPAWRIPVRNRSRPPLVLKSSLSRSKSDEISNARLLSYSKERDVSHKPVSPHTQQTEIGSRSTSPEQEPLRSIWRPARRKRRTKKAVIAEKNLKGIRAESEDPLHSDFQSDTELSAYHPPMTIITTQSQQDQQIKDGSQIVYPKSIERKSSETSDEDTDNDSDEKSSTTELSDGENDECETLPPIRSDVESSRVTRRSMPRLSERPEASSPEPFSDTYKIDDSGEWEVEQITDSRMQGRTRKLLQYKVIWKGYDPTWSNWTEVLPGCDRLVEKFHTRYPEKPGPPKDYSFQPASDSTEDDEDEDDPFMIGNSEAFEAYPSLVG